MTTGSPVSSRTVKERLRSIPGGSPANRLPSHTKSNHLTITQPVSSPSKSHKNILKQINGNSKPPKGPEKPIAPYMRYSKKVWETVSKENPELKLWEIGKVIGQKWRNLSNDEKKAFQDEYDVDKQRYEKELLLYKSSPAYLSYIQAQASPDPIPAEEAEDVETKHNCPTEKVVHIEHLEDEEGIKYDNVKSVSEVRFKRNQQLIGEVLSDSAVPDVTLEKISENRTKLFKRQIESITEYQKKLENELIQMEERHLEKKRKIQESRDKFTKSLKELENTTNIDTKFDEMVEEQRNRLRMELEQQILHYK